MSEPLSAFAVYQMKRKQAQMDKKSNKNKKRIQKLERVDKADATIIDGESVMKLSTVPMAGIKPTSGKTVGNVTPKKRRMTESLDDGTNDPKLLNGLEEKKTMKNNIPGKVKVSMVQVKHLKDKKVKNTNSKKVSILLSSLNLNSIPAIENKYAAECPLRESRAMFEWLIHPLKLEDFFEKHWERTPVHIKRGRPSYYKFLMSTPLLDKILRDNYIQFTKNIDITSYENGVRETHNPPGRAMPSVVWDYYVNGCSVRMLNPQTFIPKLHALNATLQEFFGCFVGANSYLTPPSSQGFAPHFDDIEAFILQVEGKKRWRLYQPRDESEFLARESSQNFDQSEIGEPIFDEVLNPGDFLYFPRGTIHQGEALDSHSLHITLSVYQKNSFGDFLERLIPDALQTAIQNDSEFREGLPLDYLRYTGFLKMRDEPRKAELFREKVKKLCMKMLDYLDVDRAADLMARNHVHDFLPPVLSDLEKKCSVVQDGEEMTQNGVVQNRVEIEPDTKIRLVRSHCVRLVQEGDVFLLYYSTENSKEYHELDSQFFEVGPEFLPAIQEIISKYPSFVRVEDLPIEGEDNKIQIAKQLWEKCVVITDNPLCIID